MTTDEGRRSRTLPTNLLIWSATFALVVAVVGAMLAYALPGTAGDFAWSLSALVIVLAGLVFVGGLVAKLIEVGVRAGRQN